MSGDLDESSQSSLQHVPQSQAIQIGPSTELISTFVFRLKLATHTHTKPIHRGIACTSAWQTCISQFGVQHHIPALAAHLGGLVFFGRRSSLWEPRHDGSGVPREERPSPQSIHSGSHQQSRTVFEALHSSTSLYLNIPRSGSTRFYSTHWGQMALARGARYISRLARVVCLPIHSPAGAYLPLPRVNAVQVTFTSPCVSAADADVALVELVVCLVYMYLDTCLRLRLKLFVSIFPQETSMDMGLGVACRRLSLSPPACMRFPEIMEHVFLS